MQLKAGGSYCFGEVIFTSLGKRATCFVSVQRPGPQASAWPCEAQLTGDTYSLRILGDQPRFWDPGSVGFEERLRRERASGAKQELPRALNLSTGLKGQAAYHRLVPGRGAGKQWCYYSNCPYVWSAP